VPAAGVPARRPVEGVKVTPAGGFPLRVKLGVGTPLAVTVKVPAVPTGNVVLFVLVITGAWALAEFVKLSRAAHRRVSASVAVGNMFFMVW
jgi:hypothetical protein